MENFLNEDSSTSVKFEEILYEEIRAYFQYISNPCDEKMVVLSTIAGITNIWKVCSKLLIKDLLEFHRSRTVLIEDVFHRF